MVYKYKQELSEYIDFSKEMYMINRFTSSHVYMPTFKNACSLETSISRRRRLEGQFLTRLEEMRVVAVFLDTIATNVLRNENQGEKGINVNTFLAISDFWSGKNLERARVYTRTKKWEEFGSLQKNSNFSGRLVTHNKIVRREKGVYETAKDSICKWIVK